MDNLWAVVAVQAISNDHILSRNLAVNGIKVDSNSIHAKVGGGGHSIDATERVKNFHPTFYPSQLETTFGNFWRKNSGMFASILNGLVFSVQSKEKEAA